MNALQDLITAELGQPVDPRVAGMAAAIAASHGAASRGVIFYGSCLREAQLDGLMLDFYLVVSDYAAAYDRGWQATANRLIPPNVFPFTHNGLAAKYAVLSQDDLQRLCGDEADNVSVWARFAQPVRLVWQANDQAGSAIACAIAQAPVTAARLTMPLLENDDPLAMWRLCFSLTYDAELRAERAARPASIVDTDPARYRAIGAAAMAVAMERPLGDAQTARRTWRRLRRRGKRLSIVRLAKASFTFSGGIDYLAWKINRHAGADIVIRPWQRRWPLIAAISLLPKLLARGLVR